MSAWNQIKTPKCRVQCIFSCFAKCTHCKRLWWSRFDFKHVLRVWLRVYHHCEEYRRALSKSKAFGYNLLCVWFNLALINLEYNSLQTNLSTIRAGLAILVHVVHCTLHRTDLKVVWLYYSHWERLYVLLTVVILVCLTCLLLRACDLCVRVT